MLPAIQRCSAAAVNGSGAKCVRLALVDACQFHGIGAGVEPLPPFRLAEKTLSGIIGAIQCDVIAGRKGEIKRHLHADAELGFAGDGRQQEAGLALYRRIGDFKKRQNRQRHAEKLKRRPFKPHRVLSCRPR